MEPEPWTPLKIRTLAIDTQVFARREIGNLAKKAWKPGELPEWVHDATATLPVLDALAGFVALVGLMIGVVAGNQWLWPIVYLAALLTVLVCAFDWRKTYLLEIKKNRPAATVAVFCSIISFIACGFSIGILVYQHAKQPTANFALMTERPVFVLRDGNGRFFERFGVYNTTGNPIDVTPYGAAMIVDPPSDSESQASVIQTLKDKAHEEFLAATTTGTLPTPITVFSNRGPSADAEVPITGQAISDKEWALVLSGKKNLYLYAFMIITLSDDSKTSLGECDFVEQGRKLSNDAMAATECK